MARHQLIHGQYRQLNGRAVFLLFRVGIRVEITGLYRVKPPGHLDHRRIVKGFGKLLGVNGGRSDDQLEILAPTEQLFQDAQHEVDVQAALVGLVNDDGVVFV